MRKIITLVIGQRPVEMELITWEMGSAIRVVDDADGAKVTTKVRETKVIGFTRGGRVMHQHHAFGSRVYTST
jgi:hypothetical protein